MSTEDDDIAISADLALPPTEKQGFAPDQMVRCSECLRANPPTRAQCLYCGKALPVTDAGPARPKPQLRPLETWEKGYNCILVKLPDEKPNDHALAEAANLVRLGVAEMNRLMQSQGPLPLARAATQGEAGLIQKSLGELGLDTVIVSDEELALEASPPRRLRTLQLLDNELVLFPPVGAGKKIAWKDIRLVLTGRLVAKQVETKERKQRGAERRILDARETANDESVLDIYTQSRDGGWRILANSFDFSCLKDRKTLLARENFSVLTMLIREHTPQAEFNNSFQELRRSLELVWPSEQQTTSLGWRRERAGTYSTGGMEVTRNESQFTRFSRLCHFLKVTK